MLVEGLSTTVCLVRGCGQVLSKISFFRYPIGNKHVNKLKWLEFLNDSRLIGVSDKDLHRYKICCRHFEDCYVSRRTDRTRLVSSAVPTLFPPPKEYESIQEPVVQQGYVQDAGGNQADNTCHAADFNFNSELIGFSNTGFDYDGGDVVEIVDNEVDEESSEEEEEEEEKEEEWEAAEVKLPGTRLVNLGKLLQLLSEPHVPYDCCLADMTFVKEDISGYMYKLSLQCQLCSKVIVIESEEPGCVQNTMSDQNCETSVEETEGDDVVNDVRDDDNDEIMKLSTKWGPRVVKKYSPLIRNYRCSACTQCFPLPGLLKQHINTCHAPSNLFECNVCTEQFKKKHLLARHMSRHSVDQLLECTYMRQTLKLNETLPERTSFNRLYRCEPCQKVFVQAAGMEQHKAMHAGETRFTCRLCGMSFHTCLSLKYHLKSHPDTTAFACKICNCIFVSENRFKLHNHNSHRDTTQADDNVELNVQEVVVEAPDEEVGGEELSKNRVLCKQRGDCETLLELKQTRSKNENIQNEVNKSSPHEEELDTRYCRVCRMTFTSEQALIDHARLHTGEKPFLCHICCQSFRLESRLDMHVKRHDADNYQCMFCGKRLVSEKGLLKHEKLHSEEKPFSCRLCEKSFFCFDSLQMHVNRHAMRYQCNICEKPFPSDRPLEIHMLRHANKRPYKCTFESCGKAFFSLSVLNQHKGVHSHERPFACVICLKAFRTRAGLRGHKLRHTQDKRFKCTFEGCEKAFYRRDLLTIHKRRHTGERPHFCDICQRGLISKAALGKHIMSHSSERLYQCDVCGKSYKTKRILQDHKKIHTDTQVKRHSTRKKNSCEEVDSYFQRDEAGDLIVVF